VDPAQHAADAGVEHPRLDRLDDVVVGPRLEAGDDVHVVASGGQHDDGHVPDGPQAPAHLESVDAGQHQVEDHDVGRVLAGQP
jgi:hypothetical protein